jgi:energy-coupling factor transporter transmembrane protein EcfT
VPVVVVTGLTILFGWIFHSSAPRKLAMGVSYAVFIFVVWQINRKWFLILIGSVLLFMLFFPHRTRQQISEFLGDAGKILKEEHTVQIEKEKEK